MGFEVERKSLTNNYGWDNLGRILISLFVPIVTFIVLWQGFVFLRESDAPKIVIALVAILWGGGGVALLYFISNWIVEQFPTPWVRRLQPFVFVGPAIAIVFYYLALPTVRTFIASLQNRDGTAFIGLENYVTVFTQPFMLVTFRNNLLWIVFGASLTIILGLLIATLADRSRFERVAKIIIFMPMAISLVGAGVIWKFVYAVKDVSDTQIGLLNAVLVSLGGQPQAWIAQNQPWNNLFLIVIVIWLQTGYAMVLFSAALTGIPGEILEAARVDGANELQVFSLIMVPSIRGTIIAVSTTAGATVVSSLPFQASQDTRLATPNATDPNLTCADAGGGKTVWYVYTAGTTQYITFSSRGSTPSDYDVAMGLLTGTCGNLTLVACNDDMESGIVRASEIIYKVSAGTTYYIHVAEWKGGGPSGGVPTGGDLVFSVPVSDIRLYRGPKSATVASGLVRDTGPASTLAPLFDPIPKPIRNKPPVQLIPAPEGVTPPSGPEGSNYVDLGTERSVSALATQPVVFENFEGIPQTNSIPPDPDVAVGPNHCLEETPLFSSDGKHLAYVAMRAGKTFVVDGAEGPLYWKISQPVFSPDSRHLAYAAFHGLTATVLLDGKEGPQHTIGNIEGSGIEILFSPDSRRMAYRILIAGKAERVVVDGVESKLHERVEGGVSFSPDSKHLAYWASPFSGKWYVVVDGHTTAKYTRVLEHTRPIFDGSDSLHALAVRGEEVVLLQIKIPMPSRSESK